MRRIGFLLLGLGAALLSWLALTTWRGDPVTSLYTRYEQHNLGSRLDATAHAWQSRRRAARPLSATTPRLPVTATIERNARAFAHTLHDGDPVGRLVIPRLRLKIIVVQGTSESDLMRGPGHYDAASGQSTGLPGQGRNVGIAGHRTTYLHPFRHIDELQLQRVR